MSDKNKRAIYDQFGEEGLKAGPPPSGGASAGPGGFPGGFSFPGGGGTTFTFTSGGGGFRPSNADDIFRHFFSSFGGGAGGFGMSMDDDDDFMMGGGMPGGFGGGARRRAAQQPQKPPAVKRSLPISLEDLYTGTTKRLKVTRKLRDGATGRFITTDKILTINVKPGWKAGTKIRFPGEGDELETGEAQDIEFIVEEKPHPVFKRDGDNLRMTMEISLADALAGFARQIKTLDGRTLNVNNTSSVIQPGQESRVIGEGMPNSKTGRKGDLIITYKVKFPTTLTPAQKNLIRQQFG